MNHGQDNGHKKAELVDVLIWIKRICLHWLQ